MVCKDTTPLTPEEKVRFKWLPAFSHITFSTEQLANLCKFLWKRTRKVKELISTSRILFFHVSPRIGAFLPPLLSMEEGRHLFFQSTFSTRALTVHVHAPTSPSCWLKEEEEEAALTQLKERYREREGPTTSIFYSLEKKHEISKKLLRQIWKKNLTSTRRPLLLLSHTKKVKKESLFLEPAGGSFSFLPPHSQTSFSLSFFCMKSWWRWSRCISPSGDEEGEAKFSSWLGRGLCGAAARRKKSFRN